MKTSIKRYLDAFVGNTMADAGLDAGNFSIDYSTVGAHAGAEAIQALATPGDYAIRYNICSNVTEYQHDGKDISILNAYHFFVRKIGGELHPLIFGGRYRFACDDDKIEHVDFDLVAEMGNTWEAKTQWGYRLCAETCNEPKRVMMDGTPLLAGTAEEEIKQTLNRLLLAVDTKQGDIACRYAADDFAVELMLSTYPDQYGPSSGNYNFGIEQWIELNDTIESQVHHACAIDSIKVDDDSARAVLYMFEPTRMGFKHFDTTTVYKPYYNEQWQVELIRQDGQWLVKNMTEKPVSRFGTIAYTTVELNAVDVVL